MDSQLPPDPKDKQVEPADDLGDDLVELTSVRPLPRSPEITDPLAASDDHLHNAQILMGESLWDQAKKALRQSLRLNPANQVAQRLLDQLNQKELHQLIDQKQSTDFATTSVNDTAAVLRQLDEDWSLGIQERLSGEHSEEVYQCVRKLISGLSSRDRLDLAVGFLQVEMPEISLMLLDQKKKLSPDHLGVRYLALIEVGRAFDCIQELEASLFDDSLELGVRKEFEYLLARAREALGENEVASFIYSSLAGYRDSSDRCQSLKQRLGIE